MKSPYESADSMLAKELRITRTYHSALLLECQKKEEENRRLTDAVAKYERLPCVRAKKFLNRLYSNLVNKAYKQRTEIRQ